MQFAFAISQCRTCRGRSVVEFLIFSLDGCDYSFMGHETISRYNPTKSRNLSGGSIYFCSVENSSLSSNPSFDLRTNFSTLGSTRILKHEWLAHNLTYNLIVRDNNYAKCYMYVQPGYQIYHIRNLIFTSYIVTLIC